MSVWHSHLLTFSLGLMYLLFMTYASIYYKEQKSQVCGGVNPKAVQGSHSTARDLTDKM